MGTTRDILETSVGHWHCFCCWFWRLQFDCVCWQSHGGSGWGQTHSIGDFCGGLGTFGGHWHCDDVTGQLQCDCAGWQTHEDAQVQLIGGRCSCGLIFFEVLVGITRDGLGILVGHWQCDWSGQLQFECSLCVCWQEHGWHWTGKGQTHPNAGCCGFVVFEVLGEVGNGNGCGGGGGGGGGAGGGGCAAPDGGGGGGGAGGGGCAAPNGGGAGGGGGGAGEGGFAAPDGGGLSWISGESCSITSFDGSFRVHWQQIQGWRGLAKHLHGFGQIYSQFGSTSLSIPFR